VVWAGLTNWIHFGLPTYVYLKLKEKEALLFSTPSYKDGEKNSEQKKLGKFGVSFPVVLALTTVTILIYGGKK